jgi:hypothetical protein
MYSFGHSEYNQHGDNTRSNRDYVDAHYYFLPQQVLIEGTAAAPSTKAKTGWKTPSTTGATREVHIKRISCGANYTVALDDRGDVYSWGWNESGVLGHGVRHFASAPQRIEALGASFDGCRVRALCAGGKHVVAVAEAQGHAWAASFHSILESDRHVDCVIDIHDAAADLASKYAPGRAQKGSAAQTTRQTSFPCPGAIRSARSTFLRGYINAALRWQQSSDAESDERPDRSGTVLRIALPSAYANAVTVRSLLDYLYLDRVQVASHKREELKLLAEDLGIERLSLLLSGDESQLRSVPSVFTANMTQLLNSPDHADVVFVCSKSACEVPSVPDHSSQDADITVAKFKPSEYDFVLYAHRAVIGTRLPYFEAMLTSGFAESNRKVRVCAPFNGPQSTATLVDVGGLVEEGIDLAVLEMVLLYTYTGHFYKEFTKGKHCNTCLFLPRMLSRSAAKTVFLTAPSTFPCTNRRRRRNSLRGGGPQRHYGCPGGREPPGLHHAHAALRAPPFSPPGRLFPSQCNELLGIRDGVQHPPTRAPVPRNPAQGGDDRCYRRWERRLPALGGFGEGWSAG